MQKMDDRYVTPEHLSNEELKDAINVIPGLFWRIELAQNRIEYLNNYKIPGLGDDSVLLLQNSSFSRNVILDEDYYLFEGFLDAIKSRKPFLTIVRIKHHGSSLHWIKLVGAPDPYRSNYYLGYLLDATASVDIIRRIDNQGSGIGDKVSLFDNPIVVCSFSGHNIVAANESALSFFKRSRDEMCELHLEDLFLDNFNRYQYSVFEEIIFHERWSGEAAVQDSERVVVSVDVGIRPLVYEGENFLWVSFYNISQKSSGGRGKETFFLNEKHSRVISSEADAEMNRIIAGGDLSSILTMLITHQPIQGLADSILYSDIYREEEVVQVYGRGACFENLTFGETFPFEGTIAENILKYDLQQIIVGDTMRSIKPIDWALFIPHGVRSYFAYPFFEEEELRTVLIFCSEKTNIFNEENVLSCHALFPYFFRGLETWKLNQKNS